MAEILQFKVVPKGRAGTTIVGPCEVVIFPGVRIEREAFSLADRVNMAAHCDPGSRRFGGANED